MKKNISSRIVFRSALVAILIFSGFLFLNNAINSFGQTTGECYPESLPGANDGFCMGIEWNPSVDIWHPDQSVRNFTASPAITPEPTEAEIQQYSLYPDSCSTGVNYGDTCPNMVCYTYKRSARICSFSPINRFDNLAPVCGAWSGSGPNFTLANSTDAPASGNSGSSGIKVAGGTCTALDGGTCTIDIYDVALNATTCTSPVYSAPVSCSAEQSFTPSSVNVGDSVSQACSFTNFNKTKFDYSWSCSNGSSGVINSLADCTKVMDPVPTSFFPVGQTTTCTITATPKVGVNGTGCSADASLSVSAGGAPLSCSPLSATTDINAGSRFEAAGGDGNFNWSILNSGCYGEIDPSAPNGSIFWGTCNNPTNTNVIVADNSGHQASCALSVGATLDCSVNPSSVVVSRGGSVGFGVESNIPSVSGNPIYVAARDFINGIYSNLGPGQVIPVGGTSLNFNVDVNSSAALGSSNFNVYCSMDCPVGACPSGGEPSNVDTNPVTITVIDGGSCPTGQTNPYYACQNFSCTRFEACGINSGGCSAANVGSGCGSPVTGTIVVNSAPSSSWTLTGPEAHSDTGTTETYSDVPLGIYTLITQGGFQVDNESQTLVGGGTIVFNIISGGTPTCFVEATPSSDSVNVGANATFTAVTSCSDGSIPPDNINLTDWSVNKSASFVSGQNNSATTVLRCDSSTGGVPAVVTPTLGSLISIGASLACNPVLSCSPINQTVDVNQNAALTAAGGSTYTWTATGGVPASGSSASFTTKYTTIGNKTVTVTSGGNNASCSVNVIQPKHTECTISGGAPACTIVDGRSPDRCSTSCDCGDTSPACGGPGDPPGGDTKYSCKSGSCQPDATGQYTDSTCGGVCTPTYYSCSSGACGVDPNGQFTSANCNNMCVMPIYGRCSADSFACVNTTDPSGGACSGDLACGTTGETHLGCNGNACVIMSGPGTDDCSVIGEACSTTGGKCSLKAAPPLVSGGQSVKLTWQCVGNPVCKLTRKYKNSSTIVTLQGSTPRTTGNYSEKPTSSATYTLDCDGSSADAIADVKVSTLIECAPTDPTCKP